MSRPDDGEFLTIAEVASLLKLSERTIYRLAASGGLPGFKPGGGTWRFRRADIDAWADGQVARQRDANCAGVNGDEE